MRLSSYFSMIIPFLMLASLCSKFVSGILGNTSGCFHFAQCSQLCNNLGECDCISGFKLGSDKKSCKLIHTSWRILYSGVFETGFLQMYSNRQRGRSSSVQIHGSKDHPKWNPVHITFDARNQQMYWTSPLPDSHKIYNISTNNPEQLGASTVLVDKFELSGIALDWITGNFYISGGASGKIVVCQVISNKSCVVVITDKYPQELALHPNLGIMFWVNSFSNKLYIVRAGMAGANLIEIVANLSHCKSVTVDQGNARIYWVGSHLNVVTIESTNFDGGNRQAVIPRDSRGNLIDVLGFDILGGIMVLSSNSGIVSADKFTGGNVTRLVSSNDTPGFSFYSRILVDHVAKQPIYRANPCLDKTLCLSGVCVLSEVWRSLGYACLLSDDEGRGKNQNEEQRTGDSFESLDSATLTNTDHSSVEIYLWGVFCVAILAQLLLFLIDRAIRGKCTDNLS